jgi:hypothetical protein
MNELKTAVKATVGKLREEALAKKDEAGPNSEHTPSEPGQPRRVIRIREVSKSSEAADKKPTP